MLFSLSLALAASCIALGLHLVLSRKDGRLRPPGPTPLPIIGNLLSMPKTFQWIKFRDMSLQYGALRIWRLTVSGPLDTHDDTCLYRLRYYIPYRTDVFHGHSQFLWRRQRTIWKAIIDILWQVWGLSNYLIFFQLLITLTLGYSWPCCSNCALNVA